MFYSPTVQLVVKPSKPKLTMDLLCHTNMPTIKITTIINHNNLFALAHCSAVYIQYNTTCILQLFPNSKYTHTYQNLDTQACKSKHKFILTWRLNCCSWWFLDRGEWATSCCLKATMFFTSIWQLYSIRKCSYVTSCTCKNHIYRDIIIGGDNTSIIFHQN